MRTKAPPLLPIFRSELQGRLLALLYSDADRGWTMSDLARALSAHVATVQREASRLEEAGILQSERVGRSRVLRPNLKSPYAEDLSSLVTKAFGPAYVLAPLLAEVPGVDEAYLFGSWAARYAGERGPAPGDVDVLVIGGPDLEALDAAAVDAQGRLGREVNVTIRNREEWARGRDGFVRTVKAGALELIDLGDR
ncbi:MAG TPA: ArsR family transcriptional regulator [Actinomycetota bacterium]|nr:ArsR family transcriptional regulator [Actinomycetota bacterium]